jgi:hypothetical protein
MNSFVEINGMKDSMDLKFELVNNPIILKIL